jgi:hypothetical protein
MSGIPASTMDVFLSELLIFEWFFLIIIPGRKP